MPTAELVREQSPKTNIEPMSAPAGIKTILFHVHDDAGLPGRVQTALSIARAFGAHLHLLHVTPLDAYTVVDAMGTYVNEGLVEMLEGEAAKVKASLEEQLAKEDVSWDYEEVTGALMNHLMERAALADLILPEESRTNGSLAVRRSHCSATCSTAPGRRCSSSEMAPVVSISSGRQWWRGTALMRPRMRFEARCRC